MPESGSKLITTKLVVDDLEKTGSFYCQVYGLSEKARIQAAIGDEAIDEIVLGHEGSEGASLMLMKYVDRPFPPLGEVALVFMDSDLDALCARARAAGGRVVIEPYQSDATPFRAAFIEDPEGHLIENIEGPKG